MKNIIADNDIRTINNALDYALEEGFPRKALEDYIHLLNPHGIANIPAFKLTFSDIHDMTLMKLKMEILRLDKVDKKKTINYLKEVIEDLNKE